MSSKQILVYVTNEVTPPFSAKVAGFQRWFPSFSSLLPTDKPIKYLIYTLYLIVGVFRNEKYFNYYYIKDGSLASSFLVVPAHYRWPFMQSNSVQFTYVITSEIHRGQGLAWSGIYQAYLELREEGIQYFWYVTDTENKASQRLAQKMGFNLVGTAEKKKMLFGLVKTLELHEAK